MKGRDGPVRGQRERGAQRGSSEDANRAQRGSSEGAEMAHYEGQRGPARAQEGGNEGTVQYRGFSIALCASLSND